VFAHEFLGTLPVIEEAWIGNLPLELFEAFAFELDEGI
jgi:hypothetical protein